MLADEGCCHFWNLSEYERLPFLSVKEEVVAFFTGGWYQFKGSSSLLGKSIQHSIVDNYLINRQIIDILSWLSK